MKTMKAVRIHSYGGPEVLKYENAPIPLLCSNDILIRVHAAGVNPIDWKIRQGFLAPLGQHTLPLILGWDVAGTIEAIGKKVTAFNPGDEIFGYIDLSRDGFYAQYGIAFENEITHKPNNVTFLEAAVIPLSALTAWQALFTHGHLRAGQKILVHAAAGGVGHYAVQLAKWKNAHVIGTGSEQSKEFLMQLGVDEFIDYKTTSFDKAVSEVDVIFDTVGGETRLRSWPLLKSNGVLVSIVDREGQVEKEAAQYRRRGHSFVVTPNSKQLSQIKDLVEHEILKPFLAKTFPLEQAIKAHEMSEARHTHGKIVLEVLS